MSALRATPDALARLTQIDYTREMARLALTGIDGREVELGVARYAINPDGEVLKTNRPMLKRVDALGFRIEPHSEDESVRKISRAL
jgi:acetyltransferase